MDSGQRQDRAQRKTNTETHKIKVPKHLDFVFQCLNPQEDASIYSPTDAVLWQRNSWRMPVPLGRRLLAAGCTAVGPHQR